MSGLRAPGPAIDHHDPQGALTARQHLGLPEHAEIERRRGERQVVDVKHAQQERGGRWYDQRGCKRSPPYAERATDKQLGAHEKLRRGFDDRKRPQGRLSLARFVEGGSARVARSPPAVS